MSDQFYVKVNGKEVRNPLTKVGILMPIVIIVMIFVVAIIAAFVPVVLVIMGVGGVALIGVLVLAAFMIIPHFILRMVGRQGFIKKTRNSTTHETSFEMSITSEAWKRVRS